MNAELFVHVMRHFIKQISASPTNPALLILDNHESHLSVDALNLAKASGVTILTLPPHCTAKLQPLDVGLNAPFKAYYNTAVESWLLQHPGKPLTIYEIAQCVGPAYMKAMTPINITQSFRKCGIFPFDAEAFSDLDYLPSSVTDRPEVLVDEDMTDAEDESCKSPSLLEKVQDSTYSQAETPLPADHKIQTNPNTAETRSSPCHLKNGENLSHSQNTVIASTTSKNHKDEDKENMKPSTDTNSPASNLVVTPFISPKNFRRPLKADSRKRKARKAGKSMIATDTPEKEEIERTKKQSKKKVHVQRTKKDLFNPYKKPKKPVTPEYSCK